MYYTKQTMSLEEPLTTAEIRTVQNPTCLSLINFNMLQIISSTVCKQHINMSTVHFFFLALFFTSCIRQSKTVCGTYPEKKQL